MNNLLELTDPILIIGTVIFLFLLLILVFIYFFMSIASLTKRYDVLMSGNEGKNFEAMLLARLDQIQTAKNDIQALEERLEKLNEQLKKCVQKVGIVRFNAFDDTGSDLSFAIAMLDEKDNGLVLSSIYGRSEARCYGKPVVAGESTYMLSDEEKQAIILSKK